MGGTYDSLSEGIAETRETVCNSDQQKLSVTTALNWIIEHLSPMLQGFNPTDQTNLDKLLRWTNMQHEKPKTRPNPQIHKNFDMKNRSNFFNGKHRCAYT